ncbi:Delta-1-pyrroline-5-carboxylate dehydrogenase 12A1, mitochondrial [Glycine soja]|uniref:Delta-1-pyrroline-5-carboxylate dehydrogenase 12A1, mitochondrial n=1 Tax=Glycine soja TaxID=3848 RepID=A0A445G4L8_GLYSO|nr:Delta-1-pyrroline-5-carboxylate dehydrogenase 12A1, mitochondrial [Glycine soja]
MFKSLVSRATKDSISRNHNAIASFAFSRCAHSLSFATVEAEEVSGSRPAEVLHLVQGKWVGSSNWNTIADPLNGDSFIKVAEVDETGIQPFIKSLSSCPKHGVHNPFKAPERYLMYGDISTKAAHMLSLPKVSDFFTKLIQRVSPKSYQQAFGEVFVSWQGLLVSLEIILDNKVMVFVGHMVPVYRSSLYMPKPPKSIFHHLLYNRRYSNPLSNSSVSNFILSSLTTHPPQHPHLRYTYFSLMLALDRPTFCSVQNRRSYRNTLLLLLNLHSIYFDLLLLRRKPYVSRARLQVSNLSFNSSLDSPRRTMSSAKSMHLGAISWICSVRTSRVKVAIITPFNFPLEIAVLQLMGALYMGNKPVLKVDSKASSFGSDFGILL